MLTAMPSIVQAVRTLDCANKVRIHYLLAQPLTSEFFGSFPEATIEVQEFSKCVAGAKDHFSITVSNRFRAAGVMGEPRMVVTFGKLGDVSADASIEEFEQRLAECRD